PQNQQNQQNPNTQNVNSSTNNNNPPSQNNNATTNNANVNANANQSPNPNPPANANTTAQKDTRRGKKGDKKAKENKEKEVQKPQINHVKFVMLGAVVVEGAVGNCVDIFLFGLFHAGHVVKYIFVGVDCVEQCCVLGYHGAAQLVVYLLYLMAVVGLLLHRAVKV
ncbi:MAG: hypothetical protein SPM02_07010, partial [Bacteroidales bacterium]|nr:hypothetical protein [Bacteroidales bacterium]